MLVEHSPVGSSKSNEIVERVTPLLSGVTRPLRRSSRRKDGR